MEALKNEMKKEILQLREQIKINNNELHKDFLRVNC